LTPPTSTQNIYFSSRIVYQEELKLNRFLFFCKVCGKVSGDPNLGFAPVEAGAADAVFLDLPVRCILLDSP
jgi:hypothetical protein